MPDGWLRGTFGDCVALDLEQASVDEGREYPVVGVLGFGRGLLSRSPVTSVTTRYKALNRVRPDQLVYSKLKAFEGAITVVPSDQPESYASQEFPTFTLYDSMLPDYLRLVTQQPSLWEALARDSKGIGGRRERLNPNDLLNVPLAIPPLGEQRRIVDLVGVLDDTIAATRRAGDRLQRVLEVQRDELLWATEERIPLGQICSVDGRLTAPIGPMALLPHVGAERIVSGTGELAGVVSAEEDGVISGKYPFDERHVVYSKIRPGLRKVAVPDFRGLCSADAYPLLPAVAVPRRYLQQLLLSIPFTEAAVSRSGRTKMPKINRNELLSIAVPRHDEAFMARSSQLFDSLWESAHRYRVSEAMLQQLRRHMLSALLSGVYEIAESYDDLIGVAP